MSVLRCSACGQVWASEYPFSEQHGGGPICYYQIDGPDPAAWLASETSFTARLRQAHDDIEFVKALGSERLEHPCRRTGCNRGAVSQSVLCKRHHFESIRGRAYPFED